jgi:hypothetical protein
MEMNMKTFIIGTVGACLLLPIMGAGALTRSPDVTPGALARFKLELVSFHAVDETGLFDWTGSDEVYVTILVHARDDATMSQVFEGVDTGEKRNIPSDQSCILPIAGVAGPKLFLGYKGDRWGCSPDGAPGPFSFTVVLREKDWCVHGFNPFSCGLDHGYAPGLDPGPIDFVDDYIGQLTVEYSMEKLMALQVGQSKENNSLVLGDGDGTYDFTWRLTRLPDANPVVSPVARLHGSSPRG